MSGETRSRSVVAVAVAGLVAVAAAVVGIVVFGGGSDDDGTNGDAVRPPSSMAALGDSITVGYNACGLLKACPELSWATGTAAGIGSQYQRILARNPAISGNAVNLAVPGAKIEDLAGQAADAVAQQVEYVTMLMGANDACTSSEDSMTTVADFRADVDRALDVLSEGLPDARLFVVSIPDVRRLWEVDRDNGAARAVWGLADICQSMLADPTSDDADDQARRERVRQRVADFNAQLQEACTAYGDRCRTDGGAVFSEPFEAEDLSAIDHFHPSEQGQKTLAEVADAGGYEW